MMQVIALLDAAKRHADNPDDVDPDEAHADDGIRGKGKLRDKDVPHDALLPFPKSLYFQKVCPIAGESQENCRHNRLADSSKYRHVKYGT